jgi:anaerobic ribonucleoside-triphosphate reductase
MTVVTRADGTTEPFDVERIVNALLRETQLCPILFGTPAATRQEAEVVAWHVDDIVDQLGLSRITSHAIRENMCSVLLDNRHFDWYRVCTRVGMSCYDAWQIDQGDGFESKDNANLKGNAETAHKKKADKLSKEQNLLLLPAELADLHNSGELHLHDLEYFGTRPFCSDTDMRYLFYYGLIPSGNASTSAVARPAKNAEVAILHCVKWLGSAQTNFAGGQGFYNFLTFLAPYTLGKSYTEIKQLMQMFVYEMMQMYVARGGQSLCFDEPIITRRGSIVGLVPIGELCHKHLQSAGSVSVNDGTEVMSLNRSTGEFEWKPLTAVHIHEPASQVVRTTLRDGRDVTTTSDHSLFTLTSDCRYVEASPACGLSHIVTAYKLPDNEYDNFDADMMFLVGVCIGDGNLADNNGMPNSSMRFLISNDAVRDRVDRALVKFGKPVVNWHSDNRGGKFGNFSTIGLPYLTDIGKGAACKHVPYSLLSKSDACLIELLDGLLSTDGNLSRNRYEFTTTSETLATQVQFIALRLGLQFNVSRRSSETNFKRNYPVIRIQFNAGASRKIKVTNSARQVDTSKPVGADQTNHDFSVIRPALVNEYGITLWKASNAFRGKSVRIKHEHLDSIAKYIPETYSKVKNVLPMEVKSVTSIETPEYVYDVSVADNENFVLANGIVAHNTVFSSVQLSPGVPRLWRDKYAVYAGKIHDGSDGLKPLRYGCFEREVRLLFKALMEVMLEGDAMGKPFAFPKPEVAIEPCFVDDDEWVKKYDILHRDLPNYEELYKMAFNLAAKFGTPYFDNMLPAYRGAGECISCFQCCAYSFKQSKELDVFFDDKMNFKDGAHFSMGSWQVVSLNLPRAAYSAIIEAEAIRDEEDIGLIVLKIIQELMERAVEVFEVKRDWMNRLIENGRIPFATQTPRDPNNTRGLMTAGFQESPTPFNEPDKLAPPAIDLSSYVYTIGVIGLDDMVKAVTGHRMHESKDSLQYGLTVIYEMKEYAKCLSRMHGLNISLARTPAETTAQRFAMCDLRDKIYEEFAREVVHGDLEYALDHLQESDLPVYYTNGTHVPPDAPVSTPERLKLESKFFPILDGGNIAHIWLGEAWTNTDGLYEFGMNLAKNTHTGYFAFTRDFTICNDCGETYPGIRTDCYRCGSESVDFISRITGYLSNVSGWNRAKKQELMDRQRFNI